MYVQSELAPAGRLPQPAQHGAWQAGQEWRSRGAVAMSLHVVAAGLLRMAAQQLSVCSKMCQPGMRTKLCMCSTSYARKSW